jgi:ABC-type phosphate/phosphonate transport system permease subunit
MPNAITNITALKPTFLSYSFMRLEINFRSSTILGLVGAGGIGQEPAHRFVGGALN